jgi:dihydrofolate synthase/folylpolyglutamate synthase
MFQRTGKAAYKANLDNTLKLDAYFNSPHKDFKSIHIAGTNGKGSVSHMLASILYEAGYKTALYTSPHLIDFRERIRIDGQMIPEKEVIDFVENHKKIIEEIHPSFFEMSVALAFDYFSRMKVDVAIIETGLGGRLDSTNILNPELSVITNISKDHVEYLGDTILEIAGEKAGIIKRETTAVIGTSEERCIKLFKEVAAGLGAELHIAPEKFQALYSTYLPNKERNFRITDNKNRQTLSIITDLIGDYQQENIITTLSVIDILIENGWEIKQEYVEKGFQSVSANTGIRGRWEVVGENPRMVCDTGHNEAGIRSIVNQILNTPWKDLHIVVGFVNDKDLDNILKMLPEKARYYFTRSSVPRSLDHDQLKKKASEYKLAGDSFENVKSAVEAAKKAANAEDMIFIGGSSFVVADYFDIGE